VGVRKYKVDSLLVRRGKLIAESAYARTRVEQHDITFARLHLNAGGIAAVAYKLRPANRKRAS
jgi:hypothetical protein